MRTAAKSGMTWGICAEEAVTTGEDAADDDDASAGGARASPASESGCSAAAGSLSTSWPCCSTSCCVCVWSALSTAAPSVAEPSKASGAAPSLVTPPSSASCAVAAVDGEVNPMFACELRPNSYSSSSPSSSLNVGGCGVMRPASGNMTRTPAVSAVATAGGGASDAFGSEACWCFGSAAAAGAVAADCPATPSCDGCCSGTACSSAGAWVAASSVAAGGPLLHTDPGGKRFASRWL